MKYPIGIQTFEEIINGGYTYVDKTELVYDLVNSGKYYFLGRPRRFGKSLLVSTLEAYFLGKKELFKDLAIEKLEKDWESYPVLHLDLSDQTYKVPDDLEDKLNKQLSSWEKYMVRTKLRSHPLFGLEELFKEPLRKPASR